MMVSLYSQHYYIVLKNYKFIILFTNYPFQQEKLLRFLMSWFLQSFFCILIRNKRQLLRKKQLQIDSEHENFIPSQSLHSMIDESSGSGSGLPLIVS